MIPFVRTVDELVHTKSLLEQYGLRRGRQRLQALDDGRGPVQRHPIEEFIKVGIDGVSIGSNDLTQLVLGVDRDSTILAADFDRAERGRPARPGDHRHHVGAAGRHVRHLWPGAQLLPGPDRQAGRVGGSPRSACRRTSSTTPAASSTRWRPCEGRGASGTPPGLMFHRPLSVKPVSIRRSPGSLVICAVAALAVLMLAACGAESPPPDGAGWPGEAPESPTRCPTRPVRARNCSTPTAPRATA